jgi:hypothetical protein
MACNAWDGSIFSFKNIYNFHCCKASACSIADWPCVKVAGTATGHNTCAN